MKKGPGKTALMMAVLLIAAMLATGAYYIFDIQQALWRQSVSDILEVTAQGGHAFEVYVEKDMEILGNLTSNLRQVESQDQEAIDDILALFGQEKANYTVVDLVRGIVYSNRVEGSFVLNDEELAAYRALQDKGIKEPYLNGYNGKNTLGYYEHFVFADGMSGLVQKGQLVSDIAEEFSLSFYGDTAFSYIVNEQGDILIRSLHKNSNRTFPNVYDVIEQSGNGEKAIDDFRANLSSGKSGVARFLIDGEERIFAYVPINGTNGWNLISIIPNAVIMENTARVLRTTQIFTLVVLTCVFMLAVFIFMARQSRRFMQEKEQEIQYREQLFKILASNSDDVYLMLPKGERAVEYVSPNVERVLGIEREAVMRDLYVLGAPDTSNDLEKGSWLDSLERQGIIVHEGERIHRQTGERRWFVETAYRVMIEQSERIVVTLSDRTQERKSQRALEDALEIARVANEAKSTFLSNMSHDIRTPMNVIVGLATLLQRDAHNPERVQEYTRKITASSQHLLGLINDVLDMSKIESGKTTLNIAEINLAEIVDELVTIMRPQAKAKKQEFEVSVQGVTAEHLLGDRLRINQVLINILSNAVKYTPVGGRIEMLVCQMPQSSKNYVCLRFVIRDNGIGMSEEYVKTIFEPFTRESNSTVSGILGTGLGMAITKNLVDLMGGTIAVDSRPGEGSAFTVDLELRVREEDIDQDFWRKHGVTRLLVVDDELEICNSIVTLMAGTGILARYALDGGSAVRMVQEKSREGEGFDLVLLDWKMPDMDGIETARRIRAILPEDVPILILTAYDWSEIEEESRAAGINGFLPKPFFMSNFVQMVESLGAAETDEAPQSESLEGRRFLAAEDNELNTEILIELLDMEGAACEVAANGKEAVERFVSSEPGTYDAILMDIQMPVMNGFEATRAIRGSDHPLAKTIPIIAMTANAFAEDIREAKNAGMDAHVAKPVDMERLKETFLRLEADRKGG